MKIVLTTLPTEGEYINWTTSPKLAPKKVRYIPLGLLSLATNIDGNHDIIILDPPLHEWTIEKTVEEIQKLSPDIVGISAITRRVYALKQILRQLDVPHVSVGGPHTTHYSSDIIKFGADSVFVGNLADSEFNEFVNSRNLEPGIYYCETDINGIKYPNRKLISLEDYIFHGKVLFKAENRLPMFSSIGCHHKCMFCNVQSKSTKYKDPATVVKEMQELQSLGCGSVHILDDNFNASPSHLSSVLDELEKVGWDMEWSGRGQVAMKFELVPRLVSTGFKRIHAGIESLDEATLKYFKKAQNVSLIKKFCEHMHDNNVDILAYFILGSPTETKEYRERLPQMIRELHIPYPFFNILFPEPNTEYYDTLLKDGLYTHDIWGEYMKNPTPYFEIPYPYGEAKKEEILKETDMLIEIFQE